MFDLFRFFLLRPPEKPEAADAIRLAEAGPLHDQLKLARSGLEPLDAMGRIAAAFIAGDDFVGAPDGVQNAPALAQLRGALALKPSAGLADLKAMISNAFGTDAAAVAASEPLRSDKAHVHDSLLAVKLVAPAVSTNLDHLPLDARLIDLIERAAADDRALDEPGAAPAALTRLLVLPADLFPLPSPLEQRRSAAAPAPQAPTDTHEAASAQHASAIEAALTELGNATPDDFSRPAATAATPTAAPSAAPAATSSSRAPGFFERLFGAVGSGPAALARPATAVAMQGAAGARFTLRPEAIDQFRPATQAVLRDLQLDLRTTPTPTAMRVLRSELGRVQQVLDQQAASTSAVARIGEPRFQFGGVPAIAPKIVMPLVPLILPLPFPLPAVHGHIKPVGMADLLVVKYQLLRYERGEVAYIENILKGENSARSVRRLETTEETTVQESETTKEEERDLQSTERFELKNETENTVSAEGNLKSGNAFSPSYGPMLEFQGGTDTPVSGSQSQSSRQASNYSREVTSRSASKVTERVRKQVTLRKLREFEEKTTHGFDNTQAGSANVTGVFQWVEKVLRGQVFNYGRRLMFDIMVPEPAAFLQQAMMAGTPAGQGLIKPEEFKLDPANIQEWNYSGLAAKFGATGIEPPPQQWITVSKTFTGRNPNPKTNSAIAVEQPIKDDYQAVNGWVFVQSAVWSGDWAVDVTVGAWGTRATNSNLGGFGFPLYNEVGSIPISANIFHVESYAISVEINCVRTLRSFTSWQSRTHDAILRAYLGRLGEYEERLANLQASARVQALGRDPDENQRLIREELKRSCISVFTYQHFDLFGAVELSPQGYVQIKLAKAEAQGEFIRFFEQAFEWEQMIYLFYPYFWGTKFFWLFKLRLDEADPRLKDFLKAGEARVTVPVRPGFEAAVAHYLETGELWNGSSPLDITSETYLPIMKEIQARDAVPGTETPYGDPWEVRMPTSLVAVRDDGKLPRWKEQPVGSGKWVEDTPV